MVVASENDTRDDGECSAGIPAFVVSVSHFSRLIEAEMTVIYYREVELVRLLKLRRICVEKLLPTRETALRLRQNEDV